MALLSPLLGVLETYTHTHTHIHLEIRIQTHTHPKRDYNYYYINHRPANTMCTTASKFKGSSSIR